MTDKETIKVYDSHGFHYPVEVVHAPHFGFSTAYYQNRIIADCQLNKIRKPTSDDDREWEEYEERFNNWREEIISVLDGKSKEYFDRFNPKCDC